LGNGITQLRANGAQSVAGRCAPAEGAVASRSATAARVTRTETLPRASVIENASSSIGRRERTKQANRGAILDAGRAVFCELGYGTATVRDIIRRTELASGTFYNYFPDKEAVFRALVEEAAVEARERVRRARTAEATLEGFVRAGYRAYFEFLAEDPLTFELTRRNAGTVRALFDEPALGAGLEELRADLDVAIERGLLAPVDTEYLAASMVGVGFEVAVRMLRREPVDPAGAADFATSLFLGGVPH
jgi:AcrR family transcriptional regulator